MPLTLVDEQLVRRFLDEDAAPRRSFERALNALDEAAVRWLSDPGTAEPERAVDVEHPEPEPSEPEEQPAEPSEPEQPEEQIEELAEELLEQEETEPLAGELAENDELRRVQAELNAKRLLAEQQGD